MPNKKTSYHPVAYILKQPEDAGLWRSIFCKNKLSRVRNSQSYCEGEKVYSCEKDKVRAQRLQVVWVYTPRLSSSGGVADVVRVLMHAKVHSARSLTSAPTQNLKYKEHITARNDGVFLIFQNYLIILRNLKIIFYKPDALSNDPSPPAPTWRRQSALRVVKHTDHAGRWRLI